MQTIDRAHLQRLEPTQTFLNSLDAFRVDVIPHGPFRVLWHRQSDDPGDSQALPCESLGDREQTVGQLHDLRRLFEAQGRIPAIEFNQAYWPDLPALVVASGFWEHEREPLMYCVPNEFRPSINPDVAVRFLTPDAPACDLVAYQSIFFEVMIGHPWEETPERLERFRDEVARVHGRSHALAFLDGQPVGTGFISSNEGVGEIRRVATIPASRHKGVASTLTSFMLANRFESGDDLIWLTAQDAPAQALYEKLGYRLARDRVYYRAGKAT